MINWNFINANWSSINNIVIYRQQHTKNIAVLWSSSRLWWHQDQIWKRYQVVYIQPSQKDFLGTGYLLNISETKFFLLKFSPRTASVRSRTKWRHGPVFVLSFKDNKFNDSYSILPINKEGTSLYSIAEQFLTMNLNR